MSIAISQPVHVPTEPFGQTGVRQYVGSFAALFCAIGMAAALTLWLRSGGVMDTLEFNQETSRTVLQSANGRLVLARVYMEQNDAGSWGYSSRQLPRFRGDRWPDSIWKSIGIELRKDYIFGRPGWWLRVKWPLAAAVLAVVPALHVLGPMRRKRQRAGSAAPSLDGFCRRCGRPIDRVTPRCNCCGRDVATSKVLAAP